MFGFTIPDRFVGNHLGHLLLELGELARRKNQLPDIREGQTNRQRPVNVVVPASLTVGLLIKATGVAIGLPVLLAIHGPAAVTIKYSGAEWISCWRAGTRLSPLCSGSLIQNLGELSLFAERELGRESGWSCDHVRRGVRYDLGLFRICHTEIRFIQFAGATWAKAKLISHGAFAVFDEPGINLIATDVGHRRRVPHAAGEVLDAVVSPGASDIRGRDAFGRQQASELSGPHVHQFPLDATADFESAVLARQPENMGPGAANILAVVKRANPGAVSFHKPALEPVLGPAAGGKALASQIELAQEHFLCELAAELAGGLILHGCGEPFANRHQLAPSEARANPIAKH